MEQWQEQVRHGLRVRKWLHSERSDVQHIEIVDTEPYGRVLVLDGMFQTSEKDEHYYHEMMVHPALTTAPCIERVLVIGGGDGGTVREVLRYREVSEVVMVEIDPRVVAVCREFLPTVGSSFDDPRLKLRFEDGVAYVEQLPAACFDVVLLDGSDPIGPAEGLFNHQFFQHVARVLKPNGVFALQSESYHIMRELFDAIQHALVGVFKRVHPYFGYSPVYGTGMWTWTHCSMAVDPLAIIDERAHAIEVSTRFYHRGVHRGAFALPNELRQVLNRR